jgi:hypothetical protein
VKYNGPQRLDVGLGHGVIGRIGQSGYWALDVADVLVAAGGGVLSLAGVIGSGGGRGQPVLIRGDVGDGVGCCGAGVDLHWAHFASVDVGCDAEVEVGLRAGDGAENGRYGIMPDMTRNQVKEILDRVLSWPPDDQEKVARFVREVEQRRADDDIGEEEWEIIEARAARRDLATDKEVEQVFTRYRRA